LTGNSEFKTPQEEYICTGIRNHVKLESFSDIRIKSIEEFIVKNLNTLDCCLQDEQLSSIFNRMLDIINYLIDSNELYFSSGYNEYISNSEKLFLYLSKFYKHVLEDSFKGGSSIKDKVNEADAINKYIDIYFYELKWLFSEIGEPTYNENEED
jgi:hypothetical protein